MSPVTREREALATIEGVWTRAGYPRSQLDGAAGFTPGWHARKAAKRPVLRVEVVGYANEDEADEVTTALARLAVLAGWNVEVLRPTLFEVTPRRVAPGYIPGVP